MTAAKLAPNRRAASRSRASLVVLSHTITPEQLGQLIGAPGDRQWRAGDPLTPKSKAVQPYNGWELASSLPREAAPTEHMRQLLGRVRPLVAAIVKLRAHADGDVIIQTWIHLDSPEVGFSLESADLRLIADLGSFEVDIYS